MRLKELCGERLGAIEVDPLFAGARGLDGRAGALRFHGNARALGEDRQGFFELDALGLLNEREDVAPLSTSEAFERLPLRIYVEAGSLLVMEGAEPLVRLARALELDHGSDHVDDVARLADPQFQFVARKLHWSPLTTPRRFFTPASGCRHRHTAVPSTRGRRPMGAAIPIPKNAGAPRRAPLYMCLYIYRGISAQRTKG